jgi:hypothetical protein
MTTMGESTLQGGRFKQENVLLGGYILGHFFFDFI